MQMFGGNLNGEYTVSTWKIARGGWEEVRLSSEQVQIVVDRAENS